MKYKLTADNDGLIEAQKIIEEKLCNYKLKSKDVTKNVLLVEEVIRTLLVHSENADNLHLSIHRILDDVSIEISVPGKEFSFENELQLSTAVDLTDVGIDTEHTIRSMIIKFFVDDLKYRYNSGMNTVRINVIKSKRAALYKTLIALILAVIVGLLVKNFVPESFYPPINDNVLTPIKSMYMKALEMIVAPVVFFSIVSCISQFSNLSELGKIGGRTMVMYCFTTIIATLLGAAVFHLFLPGEFGSFVFENAANTSGTQVVGASSIKDMIVNIIPNNFLNPFLENNMIQLIFLSVLGGIAVGMIGKYSRILIDFFAACNEWFLKITSLIIKCIPIAVFCSFLSMILQTGMDVIVSVIGIVFTYIVAIVLLIVVYGGLLCVFTGLNPFIFLKKYLPTMAQVFSMGSSNASLPLNFEFCKKIGVSQKVYSLSLPLGATINMDGTCIYLGIFALSLARLSGVAIPPAALISVLISIIVLSVGAPGIPGAGMVCLSVLLAQLNVPIEAIALIMGVDPIIGMIRCMVNCLGDVAISVIVAKQEDALDVDTYKSK